MRLLKGTVNWKINLVIVHMEGSHAMAIILHTITTNTGIIHYMAHENNKGLMVFEVSNRHILSISIGGTHSAALQFFDLFTRGGKEYDTWFRVSDLSSQRHDAVHSCGIPYGDNHNHFSSKSGSPYDGIQAIAQLIPLMLTITEAGDIIKLARNTI